MTLKPHLVTMMEMSSRKYSSDRQSGGTPQDTSYSRGGHSPRLPPAEPSIRALTRRRSDDGLLPPPPLPRTTQHSRNSDSVSSNQSGPSRRLCAKCGQPMQDKFVRAMGKKFHLDCFRCHVRVFSIAKLMVGMQYHRCLEILSYRGSRDWSRVSALRN